MVFSQRSSVHPQCKSHCGFDVAQQMHSAKESKGNCEGSDATELPLHRSELKVTWKGCHVLSPNPLRQPQGPHASPLLPVFWSLILCAAVCRGRSLYGANLRISSEIHEELELYHQHWLLHHIHYLNMS